MSDALNLAKTVRSGKTIWSAGAIDALSAKLIQEAGFDAIFTTGFGVSASHLGQPDMELYTMTENLNVVRNIVSATQTPVISDTDTGYGNALNVMRTVREFERAGVQAMIFEDQESPKRCPAATSQVALVPLEEGAAKIRAAVSARQSDDTLIIARTDAMNEAEAIERAKAYVAAGADLIQPISKCFTDFAGLKRMHQACGRRLSLQILGWLETDLTQKQIEDIAALAVYPLVPLMTITAAVRENLGRLIKDKSTADLPRPVTSMADFKTFIGFDETEQLQNQFLNNQTLDT
jgi:2-methylisocitrate lyase-like PEP mutase family enzyme